MHDISKIASFQNQNIYYKNFQSGFDTVDKLLQSIRQEQEQFKFDRANLSKLYNLNSTVSGHEASSFLYNTSPQDTSGLAKNSVNLAKARHSSAFTTTRNHQPKISQNDFYKNIYSSPKSNEKLTSNFFGNYAQVENRPANAFKTQFSMYNSTFFPEVANVTLTKRSASKKRVTFNLTPTYIDSWDTMSVKFENKQAELEDDTFSFKESTPLYYDHEVEQQGFRPMQNNNMLDRLQNIRKNLQSPSLRSLQNSSQQVRRVQTPRFGVHMQQSNCPQYSTADYNLEIICPPQQQQLPKQYAANSNMNRLKSRSNPSMHALSANQFVRQVPLMLNYQNRSGEGVKKSRSANLILNKKLSTSQIIF